MIGTGRDVVALQKDGSMIAVHLSVTERTDGDKRIFTGVLQKLKWGPDAVWDSDQKKRSINKKKTKNKKNTKGEGGRSVLCGGFTGHLQNICKEKKNPVLLAPESHSYRKGKIGNEISMLF